MLKIIAVCVVSFVILSNSTSAVASGGFVKSALNILKEGAKESGRGAANAIGQEAGRRIADRLFDTRPTGEEIPRVVVILRELDAIAKVAGHFDNEIQKLKEAIDDKVSRKTFIALLDATIAQIAEQEYVLAQHEARISRIEADLERQSGRITNLNQQMYSVKNELQQHQRTLDAMNRKFDLALNQIASGLAQEKAERRAVDVQLAAAIEANDRKVMAKLEEHGTEIARLRHAIDPVTRGKTASFLGADGAQLIIRGGDPVEAIRTLRLAIAYDKNANLHPDPASRYFLAVAYRRDGQVARAEEMLQEAVVAERHRTLPGWWRYVIEKFYGEDRFWVEAARQERRYGVRAPLEIEHPEGVGRAPGNSGTATPKS